MKTTQITLSLISQLLTKGFTLSSLQNDDFHNLEYYEKLLHPIHGIYPIESFQVGINLENLDNEPQANITLVTFKDLPLIPQMRQNIIHLVNDYDHEIESCKFINQQILIINFPF